MTRLKWYHWVAVIPLSIFFVVIGWGLSLGAIIGNSNIETPTVTAFPGRGLATASLTPGDNAGIYTAIAGDNVDTLAWYGNFGTDATDLTVEMGIYTVRDDSIPDVLIDSASVTVSSGTDQWWPVVVNIPLTAGVKYIWTWVSRNSHSYEGRIFSCLGCAPQTIISGGALESPWNDFGTDFGVAFSGYGFVSNTPAPTGDRVMVLD